MRNLIDALWRQLRGLLPLLALVTIILFAVGMAHGKSVPTDALGVLTQVAQWALPLFTLAFAFGFLVMALIELIKPSLRAEFHARQIGKWLLQNRHGAHAEELSRFPKSKSRDFSLALGSSEPPWLFRRAPGLSRSQQCDTAGFSP
jgi:hypothetical protein